MDWIHATKKEKKSEKHLKKSGVFLAAYFKGI